MASHSNVDLKVAVTHIELPLEDSIGKPDTRLVFRVPQEKGDQWLSRVDFKKITHIMCQGLIVDSKSYGIELVCSDGGASSPQLLLPADCKPMEDQYYKFISKCIEGGELKLVARIVNLTWSVYVELYSQFVRGSVPRTDKETETNLEQDNNILWVWNAAESDRVCGVGLII